MHYPIILALFITSFSTLFSTPTPPSTKLKIREPNWHLTITETYPDNTPKEVILYEPQDSSQEIPAKRLTFTPAGVLHTETDLLALPEQNPPFIAHGPSVTYASDGNAETIIFFDQGKPYHSLKTFYPSGCLHTFVPLVNGVYEGIYEEFDEHASLIKRIPYLQGKRSGEAEEFYPKNAKASQQHYRADLLHGSAYTWHADGTIKTEALYANGLLNGHRQQKAFTRYHANGRIAESQDFQQGQPLGLHLKYHPNGKESYHVNYLQGKKQGTESFFSTDGQLIEQAQYNAGIPTGKHFKKTPEGLTTFLAIYDNKGKLSEPIQEFYSKDTPKAKYTKVNQEYEGEFLEWYPSGTQQRHLFYSQGNLDGLQQEYFDDGSPKVRVVYKEGRKHGLYEAWHRSGTPYLSITFENGIRNGPSTIWHANGQKAVTATYQQGLRIGSYQEWWGDGSLKYSAQFAEGNLEGPVTEFYANGKPASKGHYIAGKLDGNWLSWHENGSPYENMHYKEGLPIGEHRLYYTAENDQPPQLSRELNYLEGKLHGEQKSFFPNGQLQALMTYQHGLLHGRKALWDNHETLLEEANYIDGSLEGKFFLHKPDGSEVIYTYANNQREGLHQEFFPPSEFFGKIKSLEANYIHGLLEGEMAEFNNAGTKISSIHYRNGLKEGTTSLYLPDGRLSITAEFQHDNQNGMAYEYYPNGTVMKQAFFVEDQKEGEEKSFHANGQLATLDHYVKGKLNGTSSQWNKHGVLIFEAEYVDGKKDGKFNKYDDHGKPLLIQNFRADQLLDKQKTSPEIKNTEEE